MKTALAITHVAFEDLGSLSDTLKEAGFSIEYRDAVTTDLKALDPLAPDLLIVLGGPIGVYEHPIYPFLIDEIALLRTRLTDEQPTIGICLGAQLIAAALGAKVYPGTNGKEIGWTPLFASEAAEAHGLLQPLLAPDVKVLHWHGDTFDLPASANLLASSVQYPHQAFAVGTYALGFQCHPEVEAQGLERWYVGHASELAQAGINISMLREAASLHAPKLAQHAKIL